MKNRTHIYHQIKPETSDLVISTEKRGGTKTWAA